MALGDLTQLKPHHKELKRRGSIHFGIDHLDLVHDHGQLKPEGSVSEAALASKGDTTPPLVIMFIAFLVVVGGVGTNMYERSRKVF